MIDYAIELGHKVVAITDHESISNAIKVEKYYKKIKEKNPDFKVILGNEIYLCRNGLTANNFDRNQDKYSHFVLLAKDGVGHQQIREISTRAWGRSYMYRGMRRVPTYYQDLIDIIKQNPGHVIGSTACLGGALPTQILKWRATQDSTLMEKVKIWISQMQNIFGEENFYFELQPSKTQEQTYVNRILIKLSEAMNIPYIITTDSHYLKKEDRSIHKAYLNAQNGDREVDDFYGTTYMMDTKELESYMDLTEEEFQYAYQNIEKIGEMCEDYSLQKSLKIPELMWNNFPEDKLTLGMYAKRIPMLMDFYNSEYEADRKLVWAIIDGIRTHEDLRCQEAYDEINKCLEMTFVSSQKNDARWSAYFLNLQKVIEECWKAGTLVGCGRGSGVGFILLYVLGITQINPLREATKTYAWRFLNPDRVSVLDVDVDIEGGRRESILSHLRNIYGNDRVANVATFGTEKSKSAILTAARGLGIDVDIAQYITSLIPSDRGQLRSLSEVFYGDEEKGFQPIKQFVTEMTENYPELWKVSRKIEGLVCRQGIHAGGVIFVDEPFTNSTALMRAPDGTICTQFDLHDCESASLIKYDLLSVEALDKIHNCIDLICEYDQTQKKPTLKETYESMIGIYNLEREDPKMWKMVWEHQITSLFQMEQQSGIQGIALTKPSSVDELSILNSIIRLMAQEKGGEQPLNKFARYKENIGLWYQEMDSYGLTPEEQKLLEPVIKLSYGISESQEKFMQLVQMPECGGFDLTWADRLRKSIAKKNPAEYDKLTEEYFMQVERKKLSKNLCNYVWNVLVATSRGYGFNASHTLAYSLIALQEMNLAYRFPIIFWNCACLISDSGGAEMLKEEDEQELIIEEIYSSDFEEFYEETPSEDDEEEEEESKDKKKKKTQTTDYGKIATAIGKMREQGILVSPPDINESTLTFSPDVENSTIRYGLNGISKVKKELAQEIIDNRPYTGIEDFLKKIKIDKPKMINLIKSGAFDRFGDRVEIMRQYIRLVADLKKRVTLQNMKMLCDFGLIPDEYDMQRKVFFFNKYLKKMKIGTTHYGLDNTAMRFYEQHFDMDLLDLTNTESGFAIPQAKWDNIYQHHMDIVRPFVKNNNQELLEAMNNKIIGQFWDKYCQGTLSKWEMDAVSFYSHPHELAQVNNHGYGFSNFNDLREEPEIDSIIFIKDKQTKEMKRIPLFKITRIAGTVLDKNKDKKTVTLLTTDGVVTVKIYGNVYANYDKQISVKGADGKKHIVEKSWLQRGNKIIVTGIRRGDEFLAKKYSRTPYHLVELITEVGEDGFLVTKGEREAV